VVRFYLEATDDEMNTSRDPEEGWYAIRYGITSDGDRKTGAAGQTRVFPNPAAEFIQVAFTDAAGLQVAQTTYHIFDASGRMLMKGRLNAVTGRIELPGELHDGLYLLQLKGPDHTGQTVAHFAKFIISR
jgi:hypothetical protein